MFTIDGLTWPYPCSVEREAEIKPSEISGIMLDKSYFNDVLGTYMQYTISLVVPIGDRDQYDTIYEALTDPVDGHVMVVPYGQGTITMTARVENVSDSLVRLAGGGNYWKNLSFTAIANHPGKQMSLGEMLARGRSPLPDIAKVALGDMYTYTATGWVKTVYTDADAVYY
jgi:hypothetical protein